MLVYTVQYIDPQLHLVNNEMGVFSSQKIAHKYIDEELKTMGSDDHMVYFIVTAFNIDQPCIVLKEYKVTSTGEHISY